MNNREILLNIAAGGDGRDAGRVRCVVHEATPTTPALAEYLLPIPTKKRNGRIEYGLTFSVPREAAELFCTEEELTDAERHAEHRRTPRAAAS